MVENSKFDQPDTKKKKKKNSWDYEENLPKKRITHLHKCQSER